jgi:hypothetical protein
MLETIREFAAERLEEAGRTEDLRRAHAHYFTELAERMEPLLIGATQKECIDKLEREHDNLRAALRWGLREPDGAEVGMRLVGALGRFWSSRDYLAEGRQWVESFLALPQAAGPTALRARVLNTGAALADNQEQQIWAALMTRLGRIPQYRQMFQAAYPGTRFEDMTFAHASNAIAGFLTADLAFNNSPWDRFLAGNDNALTPIQLAGAKNFMSARCSICHNGPAFTDNKFHNVALAQFGPGEGDGAGGRDDFGRMRVTGLAADQYAFRTPPLRNVELTGPWGHDGAFTDLRGFIDHYSESDVKLRTYDVNQLESLLRGTVLPTADAILASRDPLLQGVVFTPQQVDEVTEFMLALTDPAARNLRLITPPRVPSGIPVDGTRLPR